MILETIIGLGALFLVVNYWEEIVNWLKNLVVSIHEALINIAHAIDVLAQKVKNFIIEFIYKVYYKQQGKWIEEKTIREIPESEVPPHIRNKVKNRETIVNKEIEQELGLTL